MGLADILALLSLVGLIVSLLRIRREFIRLQHLFNKKSGAH